MIAQNHEQLCLVTNEEHKITIDHFISEIIDDFIESINFLLSFATSKADGNQFQKVATKLCVSKNIRAQTDSDKLHNLCEIFYTVNPQNYELKSIVGINLDEDAATVPAISYYIKVKVPKFRNIEKSVVRKLNSIPVPLAKSDKYYHFRQFKSLSTYFAEIPQLERKIDLSNCENNGKNFFCRYDLLNDLFGTKSVCLNSLFENRSSCAIEIITSHANCVVKKMHDVALVSHVGAFRVENLHQTDSNLFIYNSKQHEIAGNNITIISGLKDPVKILCENAFYDFSPNILENSIMELRDFENISSQIANLSDLSSLLISNSAFSENSLEALKTSDDRLLQDFSTLNDKKFFPSIARKYNIDTDGIFITYFFPVIVIICVFSLLRHIVSIYGFLARKLRLIRASRRVLPSAIPLVPTGTDGEIMITA